MRPGHSPPKSSSIQADLVFYLLSRVAVISDSAAEHFSDPAAEHCSANDIVHQPKKKVSFLTRLRDRLRRGKKKRTRASSLSTDSGYSSSRDSFLKRCRRRFLPRSRLAKTSYHRDPLNSGNPRNHDSGMYSSSDGSSELQWSDHLWCSKDDIDSLVPSGGSDKHINDSQTDASSQGQFLRPHCLRGTWLEEDLPTYPVVASRDNRAHQETSDAYSWVWEGPEDSSPRPSLVHTPFAETSLGSLEKKKLEQKFQRTRGLRAGLNTPQLSVSRSYLPPSYKPRLALPKRLELENAFERQRGLRAALRQPPRRQHGGRVWFAAA